MNPFPMKNQNFSEKESLELISQMIQQSKKNIEVGSGNVLLYYGYPAVALSILVYVLVDVTHNSAWASLWFLMFVPFFFLKWTEKRSKPQVVTHIDKAIGSVWSIVGWMFLLTVAAILVAGSIIGSYNLSLMLPLSLLYAGIGISITGVMLDFRLMIYTPILAFMSAVYMLVSLVAGCPSADWWNLLFGASFVIMMIIPGHVQNLKVKEAC